MNSDEKETVVCPYCQTTVTKKGMPQHMRKSATCTRNQRIAQLTEMDMVPCHRDSPIFIFLLLYDPYCTGKLQEYLWRYDLEAEARPWVQLWFGELWYRAEKSRVTGRLACLHTEFIRSIEAVQASENKRGSLTAMAKMRDIGYFDEHGNILKMDMTTHLFAVVNTQTGLAGTPQDYKRAADGMKQELRPFEKRIRGGPRLS